MATDNSNSNHGPKSQKPPPRYLEVDILVVGSGPIGAVFARELIRGGRKVTMIDLGQQETRRVGDHKKNSVAIQKDISLFTNIVKGDLSLLSVPTNTTQSSLDPGAWIAKEDDLKFIHNGQNPCQKAWENLPAAAATRTVGGMGSHWTCCTPRQFPGIERSTLFTDKEWDGYYQRMEKIFNTNSKMFDDSIRQELVKHTLAQAYPDRKMLSMPLAGKRSERNQSYIEWTATATILEEFSEPSRPGNNDPFTLLANTQCIRLEREPITGNVECALVKDLVNDEKYYIRANKYVLCAGATLTAGILFNSGFQDDLPALGHYLTEQPMAFCQVILKRSLVDEVIKDPYNLGWKEKATKHHEKFPHDPLPFPFTDPDPQCYFPLSEEFPWHTQIHRDAFGYGQVPPSIDQRLVVDLRWFTYAESRWDNHIEFSTEYQDQFGMPQPTFHFSLTDADAARTGEMITDMVSVARKLGGFLPGAEPQYLVPGSALHVCGTYRAGKSDGRDSVVDKTGRVWGRDNLVLGGCGVIPTQNACNPTLTAGCFALAAVDQMLKDLSQPPEKVGQS